MPTDNEYLRRILNTLDDIKRGSGGVGGSGGGGGSGGSGGSGGGGGGSSASSPQAEIGRLERRIKRENDIVILTQQQRRLNELIAQQNQEELATLQQKIDAGDRLYQREKDRYEILKASQKLGDKSSNLIENMFGGNPDAGLAVMNSFTDGFREFSRGYADSVDKVNQSGLEDIFTSLNRLSYVAFPSLMRTMALGPIYSAAVGVGQLALELRKITIAMRDMVAEMGQFSFFTLIKGMLSLSLSLSDAEAKFRKTTGASHEFGRAISENYALLRQYGIQIDEVSAAHESLYKGFMDFTLLTKESRDDLSIAGAILADLGLGADDYNKSLIALTKNMGMGPTGAAQAMVNMEKFARDLGVPFSELGSQFASVSGQLAKLGSNGEVAFRRLAMTAKVTGLSIERLMAVTSQFDTFEGAATAAGKLNAALGGNFVNSMDLMMATDPVDRFNMIRDAIDNAGLSFETMGYYQREFIAKQAGLENASELALVMKGRYDLLNGAIVQSSQDIEDAAERAQTLSSFQEKMNMLFVQFIPIIEGAIDGFARLGTFMVKSAQVFKKMFGALFAFFGAMRILSKGGQFTGLLSLISGLLLLGDNSERLQGQNSTLGKSFEVLKNILKPVGEFFKGFGAAFVELGNSMQRYLEDPATQASLDAWVTWSEGFAARWGPRAYEFGVKFAQMIAKIAMAISTAIGAFRRLQRFIGNIGTLFRGGGIGALAIKFTNLSTSVGQFSKDTIQARNMINDMGNALFTRPFNPPSFFLGIIELTTAFVNLATAIANIIRPMFEAGASVAAIGENFSKILGGVGDFFSMISSDQGVENIKAIADEIAQVNTLKAAALTGVVLSSAVAGRAAAPLRATNSAANSMNMNQGQENTVQQPITLRIGDQTLDNIIVTAVGNSIKKIRLTQG